MSKINFEGDAVANIEQTGLESVAELLRSQLALEAKIEDYEGILKNFKEFNVDSSRVLFCKRERKRDDHYKLYNKIDISLDTFPYPGVTTSIESIWMGVPVLTLKGNNFVSRCGESINLNLGMPKFIAENKNEYIDKALSLSEDLNDMIEIRKSLRQKALNSPLFDTKNFGQDFYNLLSNVWFKHSAK